MANDKDTPSGEGAAGTGEATAAAEDTITKEKVHYLPRVDYDPEPTLDFLAKVFHVELEKDEEVLTWMSGRTPGYPKSEDELASRMRRIHKHQAFYYGTSTCRKAPDGKLYNRKSLFCRLHVVVLDDIGTKVNPASLPAELTPTYIIESSPGNFQWGFVLEEPVDNLDHAQALVSLVYRSGYTDAGGNMPTKLVRLPAGYNMKPGQEEMAVKLVSFKGPRWTPDDLLRVLETGLTWSDIISDDTTRLKQALVKSLGATAWSPVHVQAPSHQGIVDPALEWLYEQNLVYQERDEWVDIRCPWHLEHTEKGNDRAGYSPLGWGERKYVNTRTFNCFHNSCADRTSLDFLEYIAAHGGPELPAYDHVPEMVAKYVYDASQDCCWDVTSQSHSPVSYTMPVMRNLHPNPVKYITFNGELKTASPVAMWVKNPARVTVQGVQYSPVHRSRLFRTAQGDMMYNLFTMNEYRDEPVDKAAIKVFYDYLEYLIPAEDEREFFIDWLACKVQSPAFRGPALFMVAEIQGIGRNTLTDMVGSLFGRRHVQHVPFHKLLTNTAYNTFQESLFVVVDETLAVDDYTTNRKAADILKEMIDPKIQTVTVNPKYGRQRMVDSVASFWFLSNHTDGLKLTEGDRRYYAIRNASQRATPAYFGMINRWLESDHWQQHLWNDLKARPVDIEAMAAPPPASNAMAEVIQAGKSALDLTVEGFIKAWPTPAIPRKLIFDIVKRVGEGTGVMPAKGLEAIFKRVCKVAAPPAHRDSTPVGVDGNQYRVYLLASVHDRVFTSNHACWTATVEAIRAYDPNDMLAKVLDYLSDNGIEI